MADNTNRKYIFLCALYALSIEIHHVFEDYDDKNFGKLGVRAEQMLFGVRHLILFYSVCLDLWWRGGVFG